MYYNLNLKYSLILLVFCGIASTSSLLQNGTCLPNRFTEILQKKGIVMYSQPQTAHNVCAKEFGTYGTCCDTSKLLEFAQQDSDSLLHFNNLLVEEMREFGFFIKELIFGITALGLSEAPSDLSKAEPAVRTAVLQSSKLIENELWKDYVARFGKIDFGNWEEYKHLSTQCWKELAKARSASICGTCSGRNFHFYEKDKLLSSQELCFKLSAICQKPIEALVNFIEALEPLNWIGARLINSNLVINSRSKLSVMDVRSYFQYFHKENVLYLLDTAKTSGRNSPTLKFLCHTFVRLREPVMIEPMSKMFLRKPDKSIIRWKFSMPKAVQDYLSSIRSSIAPKVEQFLHHKSESWNGSLRWKLGPRQLQFNGQQASTANLASDTKFIDPTDPSYTSVGLSGKGPLDLSGFP